MIDTSHSVSYTSALTGNRHTSTCTSKASAFAQARALFTEGAHNIQVGRYANGMYTQLDWRKSLRNHR